METSATSKTKIVRYTDLFFLLAGCVILVILTTVYLAPFRLDDILHIDWANKHTFWDAFHPIRGEIVRSYRPMFAATIWILTHTVGTSDYFLWHFVLVGSFLIALAYCGMTARYLSGNASALYVTTSFFWIAFLPILNVLFWFGDLTFSIELMFIAPAWYYGIRGLREGDLLRWVLGCFLGVLAVLSKEPALVLVNGIFVGTAILDRHTIGNQWQKRRSNYAFLAYGILLAVSFFVFLGSQTKSNRFFDPTLHTAEQMDFFINDRLRYYGEILLNPLSRVLLVTPFVWLTLSAVFRKIRGSLSLLRELTVGVVSAAIVLFATTTLPSFGVVIIAAPIALFWATKRMKYLLMLPFSLCCITILLALIITVMLVKTQLTELAFVLLVIVGILWSEIIKNIATVYKTRFSRKALLVGAIPIITCGAYFLYPKIAEKEYLLRVVRDTRSNANDAIQWMARELPTDATVFVTAPSLYGLGRADDMTSKDDETKAYAQYTFLQGYVRIYFENLGRNDLNVAYLEDSTLLHRILDASRGEKNNYFFLQTGLDYERFHTVLSKQDSLIQKFPSGKYPAEIWRL